VSAQFRILACGSRDWEDANAIFERLAPWNAQAVKSGFRIELIHGNAPGADRLARGVANGMGQFDVQAFPADWERHGKRAGILRNIEMLDRQPDLVIAFTNGSPGTQHTIDEARKRDIPVEVVGTERPA
jgi:hypothetical protein